MIFSWEGLGTHLCIPTVFHVYTCNRSLDYIVMVSSDVHFSHHNILALKMGTIIIVPSKLVAYQGK